MFVMILALPLLMIWMGSLFRRGIPKEVNKTFGYRTFRSMRNQDTWTFAHRYCGNLWFKVGRIMLAVSVVLELLFLMLRPGRLLILSFVLLFAQGAVLLALFFPVERALKRNFDEWGDPIVPQKAEEEQK
jgi:uncharacterized membrane protein